MTKEEFKARVSMAYGGRETWEEFLEAVWRLHLEASNHWIPVEKTNNTINVFFRKEQDGWHTYTQYGIDLPTGTAIEFGEHIAKVVNLLNGKGATNE